MNLSRSFLAEGGRLLLAAMWKFTSSKMVMVSPVAFRNSLETSMRSPIGREVMVIGPCVVLAGICKLTLMKPSSNTRKKINLYRDKNLKHAKSQTKVLKKSNWYFHIKVRKSNLQLTLFRESRTFFTGCAGVKSESV